MAVAATRGRRHRGAPSARAVGHAGRRPADQWCVSPERAVADSRRAPPPRTRAPAARRAVAREPARRRRPPRARPSGPRRRRRSPRPARPSTRAVASPGARGRRPRRPARARPPHPPPRHGVGGPRAHPSLPEPVRTAVCRCTGRCPCRRSCASAYHGPDGGSVREGSASPSSRSRRSRPSTTGECWIRRCSARTSRDRTLASSARSSSRCARSCAARIRARRSSCSSDTDTHLLAGRVSRTPRRPRVRGSSLRSRCPEMTADRPLSSPRCGAGPPRRASWRH